MTIQLCRHNNKVVAPLKSMLVFLINSRSCSQPHINAAHLHSQSLKGERNGLITGINFNDLQSPAQKEREAFVITAEEGPALATLP